MTNSYTDSTITNDTAYYYKITTADSGGNESVKSSPYDGVTPAVPTPAPTPTPAPVVGGGGSLPTTPATRNVTTSGLTPSQSMKVDNDGLTQADYVLRTADEKAAIEIPQNTKLLKSNGSVVSTISANTINSPPDAPADCSVVSAYEFGPDGASFHPAINLFLYFDQADLSEGALVDDLYIAYWDGTQWQALESTVYPKNGMVKAQVSHFSKYAILTKPAPVAEVVTPETTFNIYKFSIIPAEFKAGGSAEVTAMVQNTGNVRGSYIAVLKINGVEAGSQEVILDDGLAQKVLFNIDGTEPGTYQITLPIRLPLPALRRKSRLPRSSCLRPLHRLKPLLRPFNRSEKRPHRQSLLHSSAGGW